jgi:hypothetical protein
LKIDDTGINVGSIANTSAVSIQAGATLLLAGSTGGIPSTVSIATHGTGPTGGGAVTMTNSATQTVVGITGDPFTTDDGGTVYSGDTTVGNGSDTSNLTATQILQNSLTVEAGSTVTISPAGPGIPMVSGASAAAVASDAAADSSDDSSTDALTAIQDAIASGSITSVKGKQLESRIAGIERLATLDPGLDVSVLESRVLASLPSSSILPSTDSAPLGEIGSGLLAIDTSTPASGSSGATAAFASGASFSVSPAAAVPEPSTLLLAALGGIGLALAARRRRVNH